MQIIFFLCNYYRIKAAIISLSIISILTLLATSLQAGTLEKYVQKKDTSFMWKSINHKKFQDATITHIELTSQTWHNLPWNHHIQIVRPHILQNPGISFLFVAGDGDGSREIEPLSFIAQKTGTIAAVITNIPNQPLFQGLLEDALIAYTFDQYLKTKDESWPLLFPMVKSVVRGMDTIQAFMQKEHQQQVDAFVLSGASKRGWTTWLTAATDQRVAAIAPMVFDVLNMKKQTDWAEKMYGRQSEKIEDYTNRNLVARINEPGMVVLQKWVDPYHYRQRYTMPKLLLLGTNDPYWVVDSLRHYWNDLPEPKHVYQTPNAGHDLGGGKEAIQTLAAWYWMIVNGKDLPKIEWLLRDGSNGPAGITVRTDQPPEKIRLWTTQSDDRDFRNNLWSSQDLEIILNNYYQSSAEIPVPSKGFKAFMGEVELTSPFGNTYKLSTQVQVTPDTVAVHNPGKNEQREKR
ncbi:MAG: PhoPQ-activated pathogenicity-like protein PqaA type [wastewater metagenome]|nr:PhoPQ-activated pathogenicity-like protein PqaA type [Candidatus Loosdrechtia aerotolerans]